MFGVWCLLFLIALLQNQTCAPRQDAGARGAGLTCLPMRRWSGIEVLHGCGFEEAGWERDAAMGLWARGAGVPVRRVSEGISGAALVRLPRLRRARLPVRALPSRVLLARGIS